MATRLETARRKSLLSAEVRGIRPQKSHATGALVPSVRELASQHGLSRRIVNQELQKLAQEGVIYTVPRVGTFITPARGEESRRGSIDDEDKTRRLMQKSVLIITHDDGRLQSDHVAPGWSDHLTWGALQQTRRARQHAIVLHPEHSSDDDLEQLLEERPAGVVFTESVAGWGKVARLAARFRRAKIPVVIYGNDAAVAGFDRVSSDHESGGYQLTRHLIEAGRTRIRLLWSTPRSAYWFAPRLAGYERAMREAGLPVLKPIMVPQTPSSQSAALKSLSLRERFERDAQNLAALLEKHRGDGFDALMATTDGQAPQVAAACRLCALKPGRDVAIAGYDNYWADVPQREWANDGLFATVDKNNSELGRELVRLLMERADGRLPVEPQLRLMQPKLVAFAA